MKFISKILGLGWLAGFILLLPGGLCAQNQDQQPPTVDLEAQPNVYRYPTAPRRRGFTRPTNTDASGNPVPTAGIATNNSPDPDPNSPQPNAEVQPQPAQPVAAPVTAAPTNRPAHSQHAGANGQSFVQPGQGGIGPPAPLPLTPEQMAPNPPKIVYQNGLLSVESVNSRLIDILNGIRSKAGIQFEGIQALQDRVAGKFGPAPADEVLTNLLQGTHFDYVIIGSPENPSLVQRVLLTPNTNSASSAPAASPNQEASSDEDDNSEDAQETPEQAQTPEQIQQPGAVAHPPNAPNGPKTAEQLLQELKQMQQNQQNQQNLPPAPIKRTGPQ